MSLFHLTNCLIKCPFQNEQIIMVVHNICRKCPINNLKKVLSSSLVTIFQASNLDLVWYTECSGHVFLQEIHYTLSSSDFTRNRHNLSLRKISSVSFLIKLLNHFFYLLFRSNQRRSGQFRWFQWPKLCAADRAAPDPLHHGPLLAAPAPQETPAARGGPDWMSGTACLWCTGQLGGLDIWHLMTFEAVIQIVKCLNDF